MSGIRAGKQSVKNGRNKYKIDFCAARNSPFLFPEFGRLR